MKTSSCQYCPSAFSLIEVTLALGVASFCLVVVFGLLPIGINTNRGGVDQGTAASLSSCIVADLRGTPDSNVNSPFYRIAVPADGSTLQSTSFFVNADGSTAGTASPGAASTFRATVKVTPTSTVAGKVAASACVWLTWPGAADPDITKSPSHYSGSYMTVVGLDRN